MAGSDLGGNADEGLGKVVKTGSGHISRIRRRELQAAEQSVAAKIDVEETKDSPPGEAAREFLELIQFAGKVTAATRAPMEVPAIMRNFDAGFVDSAQHADMGPAASASATQGQRNACFLWVSAPAHRRSEAGPLASRTSGLLRKDAHSSITNLPSPVRTIHGGCIEMINLCVCQGWRMVHEWSRYVFSHRTMACFHRQQVKPCHRSAPPSYKSKNAVPCDKLHRGQRLLREATQHPDRSRCASRRPVADCRTSRLSSTGRRANATSSGRCRFPASTPAPRRSCARPSGACRRQRR